MFIRSRTHLTAWLGLLAMWLIVLAPIVSQLVVSAHEHDPDAAPICAASTPVSSSVAPGGMHDHGDMLAACGYCDLLAGHIAIPSIPPVLPPLVMVVMFVAAAVLSTRFTPLGAFPSGKPRAPPAFSRS